MPNIIEDIDVTLTAQNDLITHLKANANLSFVKTFDKYDGQLTVENVEEVTLKLPAILVFYLNGNYQSEVERMALYKYDMGFKIICCSDNVATRNSRQDEALQMKDRVVSALAGFLLTIGSRSWQITIIDDLVEIREKGFTAISVLIGLKGLKS